MALFIIVEIAFGVVFASVMMFYLGAHLLHNKQTECSENLKKESTENSDQPTDDNSTESIIDESNDNEADAVEKNTINDINSPKKKNSSYFSEEGIREVLCLIKKKKFVLLFLAMIAFSVGAWFYDIYVLELPLLKSYVNSFICTLIILMGYIDFKEHVIPNPLVLTGIGVWVIASVLEIFVGGTHWLDVLRFSFVGFAVCGGILLILAIVLRSGLGMGDVKMFAMLGLIYGLSNTYSILICTLIPMAVVAIVLLARKKVTRKSTLPMAPFTVFAFILGVLCGM